MNRNPPNRGERRRLLADLAHAPDAAGRLAADMRVATGLHKQGRLKEAVDLYRRIAKAYAGHPDLRVVWSNLGAAYQGLNRLDDAVQALKKARALKPDAPAPHHNLGMALLAQEKLSEATDSLARAVELDPGFHDAWVGLGLACERSGDYGRAELACRNALVARPDSMMARYNLGNLLRRLGRSAEAVEAFQDCLRTQPDFAEAGYALGRTLEEAGDFNAAAGAYLDALKAAPGVEGIHNQLAQCLRSLAASDPAASRSLAEQWRTVTPDNATARHMVAALLGEVPERATDAFLTAQFNPFAAVYDAALAAVDNQGPALLQAAVSASLPPPAGTLTVLDAGCGTGLLAGWLRAYAATLDGFDIAPAMLEKAQARGLYDSLTEGELSAVLADRAGRYDLIAVGDVLPYFGDLTAPLRDLTAALAPGGILAATVERLDEGDGAGVTLRPSGRFAHSRNHAEAAAAAAGLETISVTEAPLRRDGTVTVDGLVLTVRRTG
jgi:predicted TPR repeat methyltransferase